MKRFKGLPVLATGDHYKDFKIIRALQEEVENCVKEFNVMRDRAVKAEAKVEAMSEPSEFEEKLRALLNRTCQENESNTPDFILAEFLSQSLAAFNLAVVCRDKWYGVRLRPGTFIAGQEGA